MCVYIFHHEVLYHVTFGCCVLWSLWIHNKLLCIPSREVAEQDLRTIFTFFFSFFLTNSLTKHHYSRKNIWWRYHCFFFLLAFMTVMKAYTCGFFISAMLCFSSRHLLKSAGKAIVFWRENGRVSIFMLAWGKKTLCSGVSENKLCTILLKQSFFIWVACECLFHHQSLKRSD